MYILIFKKWFYYEAIFPFNEFQKKKNFPFNAHVETRLQESRSVTSFVSTLNNKKVLHHLVFFFFFFFPREISYGNILNIAFVKVFLQNVKNNSLKH